MERLGSRILFTALLCLPVAACGDDGSTASGGDSGTESGTAGSSTGGASNVTNTTESTTNSSVGGSSGSTGSNPTTGNDSSGGMATTTGNGTTTGADACDACVADQCADEVAACAGEADCQCWLDCIAEGNEPPTCGMMCNGMPPGEFFDLVDCIDGNCDAECNGGGGSSTGGGMDGETYMMCNNDGDCPMTDCSGFLGYCSLDCMGDAMNCPAPSTGNISPICGGMNDNRCMLPCGGGGDVCPDGMTCDMAGGGLEICVFP